jgi:hypothetical protein
VTTVYEDDNITFFSSKIILIFFVIPTPGRAAEGKSILGRIERLAVSVELKKMLRLESATSRRKEDIRQEEEKATSAPHTVP